MRTSQKDPDVCLEEKGSCLLRLWETGAVHFSRSLSDGKETGSGFASKILSMEGKENVIVPLKEDSMLFDVPVKLTPFYERTCAVLVCACAVRSVYSARTCSRSSRFYIRV